MVETDELESILAKCCIIKKYAPLPEPVLGYYSYDGNYYIILINERIKNDVRLYRAVLAEEIGHYMTTIGDITPRRYMCDSERIILDKKELHALKWATEFLVPTKNLIKIIRDRSISSYQELADFFLVPEDFLMQKFKFMVKERPAWKLDDKRSLILSSLPSIFIYEPIE